MLKYDFDSAHVGFGYGEASSSSPWLQPCRPDPKNVPQVKLIINCYEMFITSSFCMVYEHRNMHLTLELCFDFGTMVRRFIRAVQASKKVLLFGNTKPSLISMVFWLSSYIIFLTLNVELNTSHGVPCELLGRADIARI